MRLNIKHELKFFYESLMKYASFYGSFLFWTSVVILLIILNQKSFAIKFITATILVMAIEYSIKGLHKVRRPDFKEIKAYSLVQKFQEGGSFPSGHSANIALFTTMLHATYQIYPLTIFFAIMAVLVGLSRVYLKRHYFRDVLGGYVLGIIVGYLMY